MKSNTLLKSVLICLAVVWLFAVTFGYYIAHKPFGIESILAILNVLGDVLVAGALYALAAALGRRLLRLFQFDSPLEEIVFATGSGLGVVSFVTFALGLLGWLNSILFWAVLLLALVLLRNDMRALWQLLSTLHLPRETPFEVWLARFCVFALIVSFLFAVCPPIGWDGLQYHLIGPKLAIAQGRITTPPDNLSLSNPGLVEMLFLAAMQLKSDSAAQLMHWGYFTLLLGAVLAFAQRYFTWRIGWLASAILVAVPTLIVVSTWAYNDVALAFYTLTAFCLTLRARENGEWRWFVLAGVFAGLAMGEKYTAAFLVPVLVALIARPQRQAITNAVLLCVGAAIVSAPWFIRNWIFMGNPVYPFVWGGLYWDSFRAAWYSRFGSGLMNDPLRLLLVPWEASVVGSEQSSEYQATIGALLLMLLPLGFFTPRFANRSNATRPLWFLVGGFYFVWLVGVAQSNLLWQTRLLFPAFPALALLAAESFDRLAQLDLPQFSIRRFTTLVVGLVLALTAGSYGLGLIRENPLAYITAYESRDTYLARTLGDYYTVATAINKQLPANARLLLLWETRPYYIDRVVMADPILDRWAYLRYIYHDPNAIADYLLREGYTHILLYRAGLDQILQTGYDPVTREDALALEDLLARHGKQIYGKTPLQIITRDGKPAVVGAEDDRYAVYELTVSPSSLGQ